MPPAVEAQSWPLDHQGAPNTTSWCSCFSASSYPAVRNVVVVVVCKHLIFLKKKKKNSYRARKTTETWMEGGGVRRSQGFQSWRKLDADEGGIGREWQWGGETATSSERQEAFHCLSLEGIREKQIEQKPSQNREGTRDNRWERQAEPLPPFPEQMAPLWATFGVPRPNFPSL